MLQKIYETCNLTKYQIACNQKAPSMSSSAYSSHDDLSAANTQQYNEE